MTDELLPANVYRLRQRDFDSIPGAPWVYWVSDGIRKLFDRFSQLSDVAPPKHGMSTGYNVRFLRCWWEIPANDIELDCANAQEAQSTGRKWFPYMKGGGYLKWYGNQQWVLNYATGGAEMLAGRECGSLSGHRHDNPDYYFREGVTYSYLTSGSFSVRYSPGGFIFDVAGSSLFPENTMLFMAVLNSTFATYVLKLINPTVNFQVGDLARLPVPDRRDADLDRLVTNCICMAKLDSTQDETTYDFVAPPRWPDGLEDTAAACARLAALEQQINDRVYELYGLDADDRAAIEMELAGGRLQQEDEGAEQDDAPPSTISAEELAVRWISYAVGVVLGRFHPGAAGALGSAVYRQEDFAVGSLPAPDEVEFDSLVGPARDFAYVDTEGGRHRFSQETEAALRDLALPDGMAVLDEGHPRDLVVRVERALEMMGEDVKREGVKREGVKREGVKREGVRCEGTMLAEVVRLGAGGDLRRFLSRKFFTDWHVSWYRKRPVYWPLQSARRGYGFVLFHERIDANTLYVLQREYLDHKIKGLELAAADAVGRLEGLSGRDRKRLEDQLAADNQLLEEVTQFAATIERLVRDGYQPGPNWIDDGVILRLAPLWELLPIWKGEPKKHWQRLQEGDYDWSHIAMAYWPDRVRAKCEQDKSLAIAHALDAS
jgi:hypothetical protein